MPKRRKMYEKCCLEPSKSLLAAIAIFFWPTDHPSLSDPEV